MKASWKSQLQISDLPRNAQIEVECESCGFFRYEEALNPMLSLGSI